MKLHYLVFFCMTCLCFSCKKSKNNPVYDQSANYISIDIGQTETSVKASELFSKVEFIPLETNDWSIIGSIDKLLISGQRYFIMDSKTLSVMIFSEKGQFIHKISKPGIGPGEYSALYNLFIDEKNKWIILDTDVKLQYYHLDSYEFIEERRKFFDSDAAYLGNNTFAYYKYDNPNETNSLIVEREGKVLYEQFAVRKEFEYYTYVTPFFQLDNENLFLVRALDDNIYAVGMDSVTVVSKVDFGNKKVPENYFKNKITENRTEYLLQSPYCHSISNYYQNDHLLMFDFTYQSEGVSYMNFSDRRQIYLFNVFVDDMTLSSIPFPALHIQNNFLVSCIETYDLINRFEAIEKNMQDKPKSFVQTVGKEFLNNYFPIIKELANKPMDDNPILIKWYFRNE